MTNDKDCEGPGYASPAAAMKHGPRETLIYVQCVQLGAKDKKPDYLATVDVDPASPTYCKVIHRLYGVALGDELHHSGWNICSSCHGKPGHKRDRLILPGLMSDRIYIVDTGTDPRAPKIAKVLEPEELHALNLGTPHTVHCLPSGQVMISCMGDKDGNARGNFALIDAKDFNMTGLWGEQDAKFGYDFWYQPGHDVLISSEFAAPKSLKKGFVPEDAADPALYGHSLNVWSWKERKLMQTIDLGSEHLVPFETRFLHDPKEAQGYTCCVVNSVLIRFFKGEDGKWAYEPVLKIPPKKVEGWFFPEMGAQMNFILMSLDDRFLYMSCWVHGDVRQYDISDRSNPKLVGQVFLGGSILNDGPVKVIEDPELKEQPAPVYVKGRRLYGSPHMLQLSLDGKRLYATNSLISPWDTQFYPDLIKHGGTMVKLDVDTEKGGLTLDTDFLVDFGQEPDGPVLAHEIRYPGGDCTSDVWLSKGEEAAACCGAPE